MCTDYKMYERSRLNGPTRNTTAPLACTMYTHIRIQCSLQYNSASILTRAYPKRLVRQLLFKYKLFTATGPRLLFLWFTETSSPPHPSLICRETHCFPRQWAAGGARGDHNSLPTYKISVCDGNKKKTDKPGSEIIIVSSNIAVFVHSSGGEMTSRVSEEKKEEQRWGRKVKE